MLSVDPHPTQSAATLSASVVSPPEDSLVDLPALLGVIRARLRLILGTALVVIGLTVLALIQITPRYTASAIVMIDKQEKNVVNVEAVLSGISTDAASIQNQLQILNSRNLMGRVVDKLGLDPSVNNLTNTNAATNIKRAWFDPRSWFASSVGILTEEQQAAERRKHLINGLLSRMKTTVIGQSTAIQISYTSTNPAESARTANAIADAYVEDQLNAKFEATQNATKWLGERLEDLSGQVQAAESAVQQYKAENNITETSEGTSVVQDQLGQISGQLILARSQLAQQEARYARVVSLQRSGQATDMAEIVASPLIMQLRNQEAELQREEAELSSKYGPRHPKLLDIASQKRSVETKIADEVKRAVQSVASDVAVARAQVNSLSGSLRGLEQDTSGENKAKIRLRELESTASSNKALYEAFLQRFKETQNQDEITTPDARIITRAEVPGEPSYPDKQRGLAVGVFAGIFLGILLAFVAERLDSGFRTVRQIEKSTQLPVLATLPELTGKTKPSSAAELVIEKPTSAFSEAVRGLRMGLTLSNVDTPPKVVMVTSSVPEEGKTTVAISLARQAARSGQRVILIDGDLRRPSVANTLGLGAVENGIVEAIVGTSPFDKCIVRDPLSDLVVLPAIKSARNAPDLLSSDAMATFISGLRAHYDLVVIDSAPLLPVHDTKVLIRLVDSVVFAIRWEKTPREAVIGALRALTDFNAQVAGVALTRADATRYHYYSYGYQGYAAYNKYYSS